MKTIAFFNNKGGVGKTSLAYHLAWMFADHGFRVVTADFDPQAILTSMFLEETRLEELWPDGHHPSTILGAINPLIEGTGDVGNPHVEGIDGKIGLIPGDLGLALDRPRLRVRLLAHVEEARLEDLLRRAPQAEFDLVADGEPRRLEFRH